MIAASKIKEMPKETLPRERMLSHGSENLSDVELLSIILQTGSRNYHVLSLAQNIMAEYKTLASLLSTDLHKLKTIDSIGLAKASVIKAAAEIGKRTYLNNQSPPKIIRSPKAAFELVKKDLFDQKQEILLLISLNSRGGLISKDLVSKGSALETIVPIREIFCVALEKNAMEIILAHNHPSGSLEPSKEDIAITHKIKRAGELIGIRLLDHLIVADNEFVSIKSIDLLLEEGGEKK